MFELFKTCQARSQAGSQVGSQARSQARSQAGSQERSQARSQARRQARKPAGPQALAAPLEEESDMKTWKQKENARPLADKYRSIPDFKLAGRCSLVAKKPTGGDLWKFESRLAIEKKGAKYSVDTSSRFGEKYEICAYSNWLLPNDVPYYSLTDLAQLDQNIRGEAKLTFGKKCTQPMRSSMPSLKRRNQRLSMSYFTCNLK